MKPMRFIYGGRRLGKDGLIDSIIPIDDNGAMTKERVFKGERAERIVGGIYDGAQFSDTHAKGLPSARYSGRWIQKSDLVKWEAEHAAAKAEMRRERLEKDAKGMSIIDDQMAELRRIYQGHLKHGDHAACMAMEKAVVLSLRRRVKE